MERIRKILDGALLLNTSLGVGHHCSLAIPSEEDIVLALVGLRVVHLNRLAGL